MLHFTYEPEPSKVDLMQGDVLFRTPELDEILKSVHPHFYENRENLYFIVLTQSCDLVRRVGARCKAPYITVAPVRSLDLVVERHLAQQPRPNVNADMLVLSTKFKGKATDFLARLFNNNEPGYLYLDSEDTDLSSDCVAFLNLSIALKSELHFDKCLAAKIAQLTSTFQAKLGWLVGQMYSRVGTEDFAREIVVKKTKTALKDVALWIDDQQVLAVEKAFNDFQTHNPEAKMPVSELSKALGKIPSKKSLVLEQAEKILNETLGDGDPGLRKRLQKRFENDAALSALLK
jgi:hypothetical protein